MAPQQVRRSHRVRGSGLQATAARLSTPCVTRTYAAVLVAVATIIPRISLTEPVGEHLIRRLRQVVQDRLMPSVRWADIPQPSTRDRRCPAAWQQYWQQSGPDGTDPRPSAFQAGHIPSWRGSCECYALPPVAAARRWLLLLLSPLLSAPCEWFGAELLLGDHRRALGFPAVFRRSKRARTGAPVSQIAITD